MRAVLHRRRRTMDHPGKPCLLVFLTTVLLVLAVLGPCVLADGSKDVDAGANNGMQTPEVGRANVTVRNAAGCAPGQPGWHPGGPGHPGWHPPGNVPGHPGGPGWHPPGNVPGHPGGPGWHPPGNGYGQPGGNGYHQPWTPTPTPQVRSPIRSAAAADHRHGHCAAGFSVFLLGAIVSWLLRF
nr:major prion protein-like [Aegilops tauschii subsp. strangulata]